MSEAKASYSRVFHLMATAFTRLEVEAAQTAAREHLQRFPDWAGVELYHGFDRTIEAMIEREHQARALGLDEAQHAERDALFQQTLSLGSPETNEEDLRRLLALKESLNHWLARFPDDQSATKRLDWVQTTIQVTDILRDALREDTTPPSVPPRELAAV